jgi:site-specific DNA recombinase
MRAYTCRAGVAGHPSIQPEILEPLVLDAVATALLTSGRDLFPSTKSRSIAALVGEHEQNALRVAETLAERDEGLVPPAVARTRLIELRAERETIEANLDRVRTEKSAASTLHDLAQTILDDAAASTDGADWAASKAAVLTRFDELDLEQRREVIRGLLFVEVAPGRGAERVRITHRLATHLEPDAPDPHWND